MKPTIEQLANACLGYDHSFGLATDEQRNDLMKKALWWFQAWEHTIPHVDAQAAIAQARRDALEEASKLYCPMCRGEFDWWSKVPVFTDGLWVHLSDRGAEYECKASNIRALAQKPQKEDKDA